MQKPKDKVAINSIPYGAYEAGTTDGEMRTDEKYHLNEICTDIQGNGYPVAANKANPSPREPLPDLWLLGPEAVH